MDDDYGGLWNRETAMDDATTAHSRTGFIVTYRNCPILWGSKLQTEKALSTTEAEYIALSEALRQVIPMLEMTKEAIARNIIKLPTSIDMVCTVFEDNSGALELAKVPKLRPRTKHINHKYHHFRDYVARGDIKILPVKSEEQ